MSKPLTSVQDWLKTFGKSNYGESPRETTRLVALDSDTKTKAGQPLRVYVPIERIKPSTRHLRRRRARNAIIIVGGLSTAAVSGIAYAPEKVSLAIEAAKTLLSRVGNNNNGTNSPKLNELEGRSANLVSNLYVIYKFGPAASIFERPASQIITLRGKRIRPFSTTPIANLPLRNSL